MRVRVSLATGLARPLTYESAASEAELRPGTRVVVPLGRSLSSGWILDFDTGYRGPAKPLLGIVDGQPPADGFLSFVNRLADQCLMAPGLLLDMALPPRCRPFRGLRTALPGGPERRLADFDPAELLHHAATVPLRLRYPGRGPVPFPPFIPSRPGSAPVPPAAPGIVLLGGDLKSDYLQAISAARESGGSALLLVPDPQTALYWQAEIPGLRLYTSGQTAASRNRLWPELAAGSCLVCGNLAALLLPIPDLLLVIVDRSASPVYRWRRSHPDLRRGALLRAACAGASLLEGSAGPSLASLGGAGGRRLVDRRPAPPPPVEVHPLRGGERAVPGPLLDLLAEAGGGRALVVMRRKSAAAGPWCPKCRRPGRCPRCGTPLASTEEGGAACPACPVTLPPPLSCSRCGGPLPAFSPLSLDVLEAAVRRRVGDEGVLAMTADEVRDTAQALAAVTAARLVLATPALINPLFRGLFRLAVLVRPESLVDLDDYDAAEQIRAAADEMGTLLEPGGRLHLFSVFHFHYALQLVNDEAAFFERERKYREWFHLPPYADVFRLSVRGRALRPLAGRLRGLYAAHGAALGIRRVRLLGRKPLRGWVRGEMELHCAPGALRGSGLLDEADVAVEAAT